MKKTEGCSVWPNRTVRFAKSDNPVFLDRTETKLGLQALIDFPQNWTVQFFQTEQNGD
jgi:hypothetical protein